MLQTKGWKLKYIVLVFVIIVSYLKNENKTDLNIRNGLGSLLPFLVVQKSALFCLIFPVTGGLFKVKLMLVWLVSTMPHLLILLIALICPNGQAGANVITSR